MNKKFYVVPEMEEQLMETEGFLCASGDIDDGDPVPVNPGTAGDGDEF